MNKFFKITSDPNETITEVRKQLLFRILFIINILGIPIVIIAFIEALLLDQHLSALSYIILYSPILFAAIFRNKISFKTCAGSILLSTYLIGILNLIIYGFSGAAIPLFFTLLVFTTVFFDIKAGLTAILLCLLPMIVVGFLFIQKKISLDISLNEISTYPISWFTASAVLFFLGSLIVLSYGIIQKKMIDSLKFSKQTEKELRIYRDKLEELVKERTSELEEKNKELKRFNNLFVDREFRIKELKDKVKELEGKKLSS